MLLAAHTGMSEMSSRHKPEDKKERRAVGGCSGADQGDWAVHAWTGSVVEHRNISYAPASYGWSGGL